jgi:hypothetical protein
MVGKTPCDLEGLLENFDFIFSDFQFFQTKLVNPVSKFRNVNLELLPERQGSVMIFTGKNPCIKLILGSLISRSGQQIFEQNRTPDRFYKSCLVTFLRVDLGLPLLTGSTFFLLTTFGTKYVTLGIRLK